MAIAKVTEVPWNSIAYIGGTSKATVSSVVGVPAASAPVDEAFTFTGLVGYAFGNMAFDGEYIWLAPGGGYTYKIRTSDHVVVMTVNSGGINGCIYAFGYIWVAGGAVPKRIDPATGSVTASNTTGYVHLCASADSIWVSDYSANQVRKINPSTCQLSASVAHSGPSGLGFDGTYIFAGNVSGSVKKINATTNAVVATYALGGSLYHMCFDGTSVWVPRSGATTVAKMNPADGTYVDITLSGNDCFTTLYDGTYVWLQSHTAGYMYRVNKTTNAIINSYALARCAVLGYDGVHVWGMGDNTWYVRKIVK